MSELEKYNKAMLEFKKCIIPAPSVLESDEYFTTRQLLDKFVGLTLSKSLKKKEFYDILVNNGFHYEYFLDEFVWPVMFNRDKP